MRPAACALCALAIACSRPDDRSQTALDTPPVDGVRIRIEEVLQWRQRRMLDTDLNGDSTSERIVLTSDVTMNDSGIPLWEDGHRWAVVVEDGDRQTLAYGAFVPNGHAEAAVLTRGQADNRRHLLVRERTPQQLRTIVVEYLGPGSVRTVSTAYYQIEQWLPPLTGP
jgi:hypothetical protein